MSALALFTLASPLAQAATLPDFAEPARTGQHNPKDAAVVIGVEDYFDVPDVPFARADAQAFDDFIRYTRGVADDRVTRLLDARAGDIRRAVQEQGKRVEPGGTLWVYFAGHGAMDPTAERRLLLGRDASTDPTQFADFAVAVDDVRSWATSGGGDVMLVVDACYNGGGRTGEGVLTGGRRLVVPNYAAQPDLHATEWAATAPQELSAPLTAVSHGAFTYFAVGALRGWADGEVDGTRDGNVTAEEANKYVARSLRAVQTQGQTPQLSTTDASKLVLARGVKELGPGREDLALLRGGAAVASGPGAAASVAVPRTGDAVVDVGTDFQTQLAAAKQAAAAEAERQFVAAETTKQRVAKLDAAEASLRRHATADWASAKSLVDAGGAGAKSAAEAFLAAYANAKVRVDSEERAVVVAELSAAQAVSAGSSDPIRAQTSPQAASLAVASPSADGRSDYTSKSLGLMKWISAGTFTMGTQSDRGRKRDEAPHSVVLTSGYWMMEHEVTQAEWQTVMGTNPSGDRACGPSCPVEKVSLNDAVEFARRASERDGVSYALPTEAQWEYAAGGGQALAFAGSNEAASVAWVADEDGAKTHPVCEKARNAFGLCDMSGNVGEWTRDFYGPYPEASVTDPAGASSGTAYVVRGGSWDEPAWTARVSSRAARDATYVRDIVGLRLIRMAPEHSGRRRDVPLRLPTLR